MRKRLPVSFPPEEPSGCFAEMTQGVFFATQPRKRAPEKQVTPVSPVQAKRFSKIAASPWNRRPARIMMPTTSVRRARGRFSSRPRERSNVLCRAEAQASRNRPRRGLYMRQATKQWLFLLFLVLSLLAMIALALRQMAKARRATELQPSCSASAAAKRARWVRRFIRRGGPTARNGHVAL